jgi:hypothetical protein
MTRLAAACIIAGLFAASTAAAQSSSPAAGSAERVESGQVRTPSGAAGNYRIRLLPVDSFPDLPQPIAAWLRRHGCMIPQTYEAQEPENVIRGAFRAPGSDDWAALCSVHGVTTLDVFFSGAYAHPVPIRSQQDILWLGHEPGSSILGSAWGISARSAEDLRTSTQVQPGFIIDHDGIEDTDLERSLTIRYFQSGAWQIVVSEDFR